MAFIWPDVFLTTMVFLASWRCIAFSSHPHIGYFPISPPRRHFGCRSGIFNAAIEHSSFRPLEASRVDFLGQVERTVGKITSSASLNIMEVHPQHREAVGVARHLAQRLEGFRRNNDCPYCWMQRAHCICQHCPSVNDEMFRNDNNQVVNRIFLLMHHKEVALKVDTAKLILSAFPRQCRLVVGGISSDYQDSMKEMLQAIEDSISLSTVAGKHQKCLVLFPDETARPFHEILMDEKRKLAQSDDENLHAGGFTAGNQNDPDQSNETTFLWDIIVIDGTWTQARRLHNYVPPESQGGPRRVRLSENAVERLGGSTTRTHSDNAKDSDSETYNSGHQLRRHVVTWRQVSTFEATRLFLKDLLDPDGPGEIANTTETNHTTMPRLPWDQLESFHAAANEAARKELGPKRKKAS